jgi:hypothetical protein
MDKWSAACEKPSAAIAELSAACEKPAAVSVPSAAGNEQLGMGGAGPRRLFCCKMLAKEDEAAAGDCETAFVAIGLGF